MNRLSTPGDGSSGPMDTIVARATPQGRSALAVVRLSGPGSVAVARTVCAHEHLHNEKASHRAVLTEVRHPDSDEIADQVLVLPMFAPHSYTGEDTIEFFCHGGALPARHVVEACLAAGARAALPGEFTRRAFVNGKLSLDQAEAVADLIHAEDRLAARAALAQLRGALRRELEDIETPVLSLAAELEGTLEFDQHENVEADPARIAAVINTTRDRVVELLADSPAGRRVRNGVQVVIAGPANAGKSSLFNALLADERALVDADAGTTRDVIRERLVIDDVSYVLHDTAGLREDVGRVETAGVNRARATLTEADIVLWTIPHDEDPAQDPPEDLPPGIVVLTVGTKCDLHGVDHRGLDVATSAHTGQGLDRLRNHLSAAVQAEDMQQVAAAGRALSRRHRRRLRATVENLDALLISLEQHAPLDVVTTLISSALQQLGEVTGRVYTERLLGEIFQRHCIGK